MGFNKEKMHINARVNQVGFKVNNFQTYFTKKQNKMIETLTMKMIKQLCTPPIMPLFGFKCWNMVHVSNAREVDI